MAGEKTYPWVVLKLDDDSEWQGRVPAPVRDYMAGMADEIVKLRIENEQAQEVIVIWVEANAAATTLINEQQTEIERLRAENERLCGALDIIVSIGRGDDTGCDTCLRMKQVAQAALDAAGDSQT